MCEGADQTRRLLGNAAQLQNVLVVQLGIAHGGMLLPQTHYNKSEEREEKNYIRCSIWVIGEKPVWLYLAFVFRCRRYLSSRQQSISDLLQELPRVAAGTITKKTSYVLFSSCSAFSMTSVSVCLIFNTCRL